MARFCINCGNELNENADVCLSCGQLITTNANIQNVHSTYTNNNQGKALATVSVVFGSLGFYPLIIIGSIVGLITSLIGLYDSNNQFRGRSKIGLGLSIGSFALWLLIILFGITVARYSIFNYNW